MMKKEDKYNGEQKATPPLQKKTNPTTTKQEKNKINLRVKKKKKEKENCIDDRRLVW